MKTLKLLALAVCTLLFSQCKTTSPTAPAPSSASISEVARSLDTIQAEVLLYADSTNGDDHAALQRTANWLKSQTNIQSTSVLDSTYLYFTLQSGLTGIYYLDEVDDNGMSLSRGGKGGGGTLEEWNSIASVNTITNLSVLLFAPAFGEFYSTAEFQAVLDLISSANLGLKVTALRDSDCSTSVVDQFSNYGLVIMDTHGLPNGFLIGTKVTDTLTTLTDAATQQIIDINVGKNGYDKFQAGMIMLARGLTVNGKKPPGWQKQVKKVWYYPFRIVLSTKYIAGMSKLTNTVLFGNMCYSGQSLPVPKTQGSTTPIQTAFMNLNPISYYGYSFAGGGASKVSGQFAKQMEDSLLTQLLLNTDSTGHCYLQHNGTEYYDANGLSAGLSAEKLFLKHFGSNTYSYSKCGDTLVDARDGQKYTTVCIGKQNWMAQNLNYNAPGSFTYNNDPANGKIYGRLYDWATLMQGADSTSKSPSGVQGVCPKGWHVPSNAEYVTMVGTLGGSSIAGGAMKSTSSLWSSPNTGATNSSGFSGLPGGDGSSPTFNGLGTNAQFSTSTLTKNGNNADIWILNSSDGTTGETASAKTDGNSCRCVKDP